jgi:hypothetical protein
MICEKVPSARPSMPGTATSTFSLSPLLTRDINATWLLTNLEPKGTDVI